MRARREQIDASTTGKVELLMQERGWGEAELEEALIVGRFGDERTPNHKAARAVLQRYKVTGEKVETEEARNLAIRAVIAQEDAAKAARLSFWAAIAAAVAAVVSAIVAIVALVKG